MSDSAKSIGEQTSLAYAFTAFLQDAAIRGFSKKTIGLYKWVYQHAPDDLKTLPITHLQGLHLRPLFLQLIATGWKPTSISIIYRSFHALFVWSIKEGLSEQNPLRNIPIPKVPKIFPYALEDIEVESLLQVAASHDSKAGIRNQAMLVLFLDCWLRLNELISLTFSDVSITQR